MKESSAEQKIRVVVAVNDLALAGAQRLAVDILRALDASRFEASMIVLSPVNGKASMYDRIPLHVRVYPFEFRSLLDMPQWFRLIRIMRNIRPDIVKTALFFTNTVFSILQPIFGYSLVTAEHNTQDTKTVLQRLANRLLSLMSETIIVDSVMVADVLAFRDGIDRSRYNVIYNSVDQRVVISAREKFLRTRDSLRANLGIGARDHVFLTVSRLVGQKNHELMIRAFANVHKINHDTHLVIVGGGGFFEALKQQTRDLHLEKYIHVVGEQRDVYPFYVLSDSFVLTSRHEGFCIAAMEALAFGLPLISTRVAGVSEYLLDGENGFFVEEDSSGIADKMQKVARLTAQERHSFSKCAEKTSQVYSFDRYKNEYVGLFESLYRKRAN